MNDNRLKLLHFNDGYELDKTPVFLRQFLDKADHRTLKLFSGDLLSPSFLSIFMEGRQFVPFLQRIQLDGMVPGNHEFDWREARFQEITKSAGVEWLLCNFLHRESGSVFLDCRRFKVQTVGSLTVGLFGLVDQNWLDTSELDESEYLLLDPVQTARQMAEALTAQGCDLVVALTHTNLSTDLELLRDPGMDVDFVLGGHNHVYLAKVLGGKLMLKSGSDFNSFSEINLREVPARPLPPDQLAELTLMDDKALKDNRALYQLSKTVRGQPRTFEVELLRHAVDPLGPFDAELRAYSDSKSSKIVQESQHAVCVLERDANLKSSVIRVGENWFVDLTVDVLRVLLGVDVVMLQSGHVRPEFVLKKGPLSLLELVRTFPLCGVFSATVATGEDLLVLAEQGLQGLPVPKGCFPNFSGVTLRFDPAQAVLSRVVPGSFSVCGQPVDLKRAHSLATLEVIARAKDGFTRMAGLPKAPVAESTTAFKAMKGFFELPNDPLNRTEFGLAREPMKARTLDQWLALAREHPETPHSPERLTPSLLAEHNDFESAFASLTLKAKRRLMLFSLAAVVVEMQGIFVFAVEGMPENRVVRVDS